VQVKNISKTFTNIEVFLSVFFEIGLKYLIEQTKAPTEHH